jgi:hypothetical protein
MIAMSGSVCTSVGVSAPWLMIAPYIYYASTNKQELKLKGIGYYIFRLEPPSVRVLGHHTSCPALRADNDGIIPY